MASLLLLKSILFAKALKKSKLKKKKRKCTSNRLISLNKCRVCNKENADIPIFMNLCYPNLAIDIQNISGVLITATDQFSKHICQPCVKLLKGCILFRDVCQKNNQRLKDLVLDFKDKSCPKNKYHNNSHNDVKNHNEHNYNGNINENKTRYEECSDDDSWGEPSQSFNDDEIWSCTTCVKAFDNLFSYNVHLKECHTRDSLQCTRVRKRVFLCETCGKTTASNASLLSHMSTHMNVFPFKCDTCPYQGRTVDLLRTHKKTHMKVKPYKCTLCSKTATSASNLMKHIKHVHSASRPFKCWHCQKAFPYRHNLNKHVNDIHLRQGTAECDICFKKFNTRKILYGHRVKIHKIKCERLGRLPAYLQCEMEKNNESGSQEVEY